MSDTGEIWTSVDPRGRKISCSILVNSDHILVCRPRSCITTNSLLHCYSCSYWWPPVYLDDYCSFNVEGKLCKIFWRLWQTRNMILPLELEFWSWITWVYCIFTNWLCGTLQLPLLYGTNVRFYCIIIDGTDTLRCLKIPSRGIPLERILRKVRQNLFSTKQERNIVRISLRKRLQRSRSRKTAHYRPMNEAARASTLTKLQEYSLILYQIGKVYDCISSSQNQLFFTQKQLRSNFCCRYEVVRNEKIHFRTICYRYQAVRPAQKHLGSISFWRYGAVRHA